MVKIVPWILFQSDVDNFSPGQVLVLDHGVTIAHGRPEEVRRDPKVIEAYVGDGKLRLKPPRGAEGGPG